MLMRSGNIGWHCAGSARGGRQRDFCNSSGPQCARPTVPSLACTASPALFSGATVRPPQTLMNDPGTPDLTRKTEPRGPHLASPRLYNTEPLSDL